MMEIGGLDLVGNHDNLILSNLEELCGCCHESFGLKLKKEVKRGTKIEFLDFSLKIRHSSKL